MKKLTNDELNALAIARTRAEAFVNAIKVIQQSGVMAETMRQKLVATRYNLGNALTLLDQRANTSAWGEVILEEGE